MAQPWAEFLTVARPHVDWTEVGRVLALDPGETTGWALFAEGLLVECGQWDTMNPADLADDVVEVWNLYTGLEHLVYEEYRIRGNRAKEHVGSEVLTIQHIGAVKVVSSELGLPLTKQTAGMAKGFATDTKLRRWGLWQTGLRHSNDAIRHQVYYHLFNAGRKQPHPVEQEQDDE
jgi:hypothetical protein